MTALGIALFRQPHRLELTADDVLVTPRLGSPRRWESVRAIEPPARVRVALEVAVVVAALALVALASGRAAAGQAVVLVAYAHVYGRWRLAPRAVLSDGRGGSATLRLDWFPGAADAIAARS